MKEKQTEKKLFALEKNKQNFLHIYQQYYQDNDKTKIT